MVDIPFAALAESSLFWEFPDSGLFSSECHWGVSLACIGHLPLTSCLSAGKEWTSQDPSDGLSVLTVVWAAEN